MKKMNQFMRLTIAVLVASASSLSLMAQWVPPVKLAYIPVFGGEKPVIVNHYNHFFIDRVTESPAATDEGEKYVPLSATVLSVNGQATTDIEEMYRLMQQGGETIRMEIERFGKEKGILVFTQKNNTNGLGDIEAIPGYYLSCLGNANNLPSGIRVLADSKLDFSKIHTYDIMVMGDEPLKDTKILEEFCKEGIYFSHLERDEENPDIVVCLSRNADESISSTYIPPQVVSTGSTTEPVYNYLTRQTSYVTTQHSTTIGGRTEETVSTSLFLEFTILDAKKMNDPKQKTAPVIWQMTYNANVTNRNFEVFDRYMEIASLNPFPFTYWSMTVVPSWFTGLRYDSNNRIEGVVSGSRADIAGFEIGDVITKFQANGIRTSKPWEPGYMSASKTKVNSLDEMIEMHINNIADLRRNYGTFGIELIYFENAKCEVLKRGQTKPKKMDKAGLNILFPPRGTAEYTSDNSYGVCVDENGNLY